ncbi:hypothetical protein [Streptomyces sp. M2CJ-2]|uniref:hypothetical protein n=1 Tax=Streptomyces sp. M2CJ-2 TaxID=2803948 RepID=UPI0027DC382D|nr:hypothetical protein [Streptomyces sp. M2CJ-2]
MHSLAAPAETDVERLTVYFPPELRLLGHFRLECDAEPLGLCRNGQRLLAFVALRRHVPRTVLAGTLWPEGTEKHASGDSPADDAELTPG